jgi:hypothetical protein
MPAHKGHAAHSSKQRIRCLPTGRATEIFTLFDQLLGESKHILTDFNRNLIILTFGLRQDS